MTSECYCVGCRHAPKGVCLLSLTKPYNPWNRNGSHMIAILTLPDGTERRLKLDSFDISAMWRPYADRSSVLGSIGRDHSAKRVRAVYKGNIIGEWTKGE
jgi:hypothetical protein